MGTPLLGTDALPVEVILAGRAFPIRHDFRDGIRFETLMYDARVPESTKVALAIGIWFDRTPDVDLGVLIAGMLDFYRCGKPQAAEIDDYDDEQLYSFSYDYDLIFAGFLNAYGIDLLDPATKLHWFKFRAMLAALPDSSQFMRVIGYRAAKVSSNMSSEERRHLLKMKRIYALPGDESSRPVALKDEESYREALAAVVAAKRAAQEQEVS